MVELIYRQPPRSGGVRQGVLVDVGNGVLVRVGVIDGVNVGDAGGGTLVRVAVGVLDGNGV
jgi:hypothetical protein